jgi:hypothetical protein
MARINLSTELSPFMVVNNNCASCLHDNLGRRSCWDCVVINGRATHFTPKIVKDCNTCETLDCNSCKGGR